MTATRSNNRTFRAEPFPVNRRRAKRSSESPEPDEGDIDHRKNKRNRQTRSCVSCHLNKRKCDRKAPCGRCRHLGTTADCHYETEDAPLNDLIKEIIRLRARIGIWEKINRQYRDKPEPSYMRPPLPSFPLEASFAEEIIEHLMAILTMLLSLDTGDRREAITLARSQVDEIVKRLGDIKSIMVPKLESIGHPQPDDSDIDNKSHIQDVESMPIPSFTLQHQLASGQLPYGHMVEAPGLSASSDDDSYMSGSSSPGNHPQSSFSPMSAHEAKALDGGPYERQATPLVLSSELVLPHETVPPFQPGYVGGFDAGHPHHPMHHPAHDYGYYPATYYDDQGTMQAQAPYQRPMSTAGTTSMDSREHAYPSNYTAPQWPGTSDWRP